MAPRLLALLALAIALALPTVQATDNNSGTVKVHDNEDENPDSRNVPHVSCDFWIEGFNLNDDVGTLVFYGWPPTGEKSVVTPTGASLAWTSDGVNANGNHHFLAGPFALPAGHYRVEVYTEDGHPGGNGSHFAKTKTFWVEPCDSPPANPPCPDGVVAVALDDGGVRLAWTTVTGASTYNVYRASGDEDFEYVASTSSTFYLDATTVGGVTYSYYVTAGADASEAIGCESVEVTAIPYFPNVVVGALALVGAVGAYAVLRRK